MNARDVHSRIASLYRELADAYDELALDRARRRQAKRIPAAPSGEPPADPDVVAKVRRRLRKQGVAA